MISDEMRELISAFVDGELRDADVARVEELTKRDPELRREVVRLRKLRDRLRDWDEAEHGGSPSGRLSERALGRGRAWLSATGASSWLATVHRVLTHPAAIAAALLVAVTAGVLAAPSAGATPKPRAFAVREHQPLPRVAGDATELSAVDVPRYPVGESVFLDLVRRHARGKAMYHQGLSEKGLAVMETLDAIEKNAKRRALRRKLDHRTVAVRSSAALSLLEPYETEDAPFEALALIRHPQLFQGLPILRTLPLGKGVGGTGANVAGDAGTLMWDLSSTKSRLRRVAPLGEVLAGLRDKSGRVRIVNRSTIVPGHRAQKGSMVWGDTTPLPANSRHLEPLGLVVGPQTRRVVLVAKARDDALIAALGKQAGGKGPVIAGLRKAMKKNAHTVRKLTDALEANPRVTGFAVLSKGRILGVELFATHELMLELAPRLLHGYLLEAPEGIQVRAPSKEKMAEVMKAATLVLDSLPEQAIKLQTTKAKDGDVSELSLRGPDGSYIGHGLVKDKQPIHLTLFGR